MKDRNSKILIIFSVMVMLYFHIMTGALAGQKDLSEKENKNISIRTICSELQQYATDLGDDFYWGSITLKQEEMDALRLFLRVNDAEKEEFWGSINLLFGEPQTRNDFTIGRRSQVYNFEGCRFLVSYNFDANKREILFIDNQAKKPIWITNSVDSPENLYDFELAYKGYALYNFEMPYYKIKTPTSSCWTLSTIDRVNAKLQRWELGIVVEEYDLPEMDKYKSWSSEPRVVCWDERIQTYVLKIDSYLVAINKNESKILSRNALSTSGVRDTLYYSTESNELHMVSIQTLEDVKIADFSNVYFKFLRDYIPSYLIHILDETDKEYLIAVEVDEDGNVSKDFFRNDSESLLWIGEGGLFITTDTSN